MTTNYFYDRKELGTKAESGPQEPQNWSGLPEGEKIQLLPKPELSYAATKNGDHMVVRGDGGRCLDKNHEVDHSVDPIAGETRKVRMRCQ